MKKFILLLGVFATLVLSALADGPRLRESNPRGDGDYRDDAHRIADGHAAIRRIGENVAVINFDQCDIRNFDDELALALDRIITQTGRPVTSVTLSPDVGGARHSSRVVVTLGWCEGHIDSSFADADGDGRGATDNRGPRVIDRPPSR